MVMPSRFEQDARGRFDLLHRRPPGDLVISLVVGLESDFPAALVGHPAETPPRSRHET